MNSKVSEPIVSAAIKTECDVLTSEDQCIDLSCVKSENADSSPVQNNAKLFVPEVINEVNKSKTIVSSDDCRMKDEDSDNQILPFDCRHPDKKELVKDEELHCEESLFQTTNSEKFKAHINSVHNEGETFTCCLCNFRSKWNREYYKHMRTHFPGPPYCCDFECCTVKCDRIQHLLYHRMNHTEERPYSCSICPMMFKIKSTMIIHMRKHTGYEPFKCTGCSRSFSTKGALQQHAVTHSEKRMFLCDQCGFSTKHRSHLISHRRIHAGDVLRCQVDNCEYKTTKRSQLVSHMQSHFQIKTFFCKECGQGFGAKSHLNRHHLTHVPDKPFSCEFCDYKSNRKDKLKLHLQKHHCVNSGSLPKAKTQTNASTKAHRIKCKEMGTSDNYNSVSSYRKFEKMIEKVDEQLQKRSVNKYIEKVSSVEASDRKHNKDFIDHFRVKNLKSIPDRNP